METKFTKAIEYFNSIIDKVEVVSVDVSFEVSLYYGFLTFLAKSL